MRIQIRINSLQFPLPTAQTISITLPPLPFMFIQISTSRKIIFKIYSPRLIVFYSKIQKPRRSKFWRRIFLWICDSLSREIRSNKSFPAKLVFSRRITATAGESQWNICRAEKWNWKVAVRHQSCREKSLWKCSKSFLFGMYSRIWNLHVNVFAFKLLESVYEISRRTQCTFSLYKKKYILFL